MSKGGMAESEIATETNTRKQNISAILKRYHIEKARLDGYISRRADIFAGLQERILSTIDLESIKAAALGVRVLAVCQLYDKEQIERGRDPSTKPLVVIVKGDGARVQVNLPPAKAVVNNPVDNPGYQPHCEAEEPVLNPKCL
ncbi:MAG: hypothetical protein Q8M94_01200 [Ignavibacteria bacterium]|nr:hypothetical protein [Ignavibacteria bacterium]